MFDIDELRQRNEELARADALRRDFTSNVSHDMKTPVHVISGYAELMRDGMVGEDDVQRFAGIIYDEAQRLSRLVDDVLTLSQLDSSDVGTIETVEVDLAGIASSVCERLEPVASGAGLTLSLDVPATPVRLLGNAKLLDELVSNLIDNAIRYSNPEGHVWVSVYVEDAEGAEDSPDAGVAEASAHKKYACLKVADEGCGIPEKDQERIFGRFVRLDESRRANSSDTSTSSTGLGLAIVKHVVQVHGGNVELKSAPSKGSTFTVRLPTKVDI